MIEILEEEVNGKKKISGFKAVGRGKPDFIKTFPNEFAEMIEKEMEKNDFEHRDIYGNAYMEPDVIEKEENDECDNIIIKKEAKIKIVQESPTEQQQKDRRHQRYKEEMRKKYSLDDEIALLKDKINLGESLEYDLMEQHRTEVKNQVKEEISKDVERIQKDVKDNSKANS